MKPKILHVSEAFGGGIVSSIYSFAKNSPDFEHYLLISERKSQPLDKDLSSHFKKVLPLRKGIINAIADIKAATKDLKPDHIHLHSTYAGVYGRLASLKGSSVIYSPHGFAFERVSDGPILRGLFLAIEWALSFRTSLFAGVSPYELAVWAKFKPNGRSVFVPNSTDIVHAQTTQAPALDVIKIACAGRIAAQKDPNFLLSALKQLPRQFRDSIEIYWIGAGDEDLTAELTKEGVRVTGWIPHAQAEQELGGCDIYLHTAAWEGFPMTVIEAAAMGKPLLLRRISAFENLELPSEPLVETPQELAVKLLTWASDSKLRDAGHELSSKVRSICSPSKQKKALLSLYSEEQG